MDLQVLFEVAAGRKLFAAKVARERLLAGVDPLMSDKIRDLREGLVAAGMRAVVRLPLVVDPRMLLQRAILSERLVALLALEGSVRIVGALVLLERLLAIKQLAAAVNLALEKHY